jgi:hypothetical protein
MRAALIGTQTNSILFNTVLLQAMKTKGMGGDFEFGLADSFYSMEQAHISAHHNFKSNLAGLSAVTLNEWVSTTLPRLIGPWNISFSRCVKMSSSAASAAR